MTGMAVHMKAGGYRTHFVGKWDVGMATPHHTPRARGYDTFLGYWHHSNDYWSMDEGACSGAPVKDIWRQNSSTLSSPSAASAASAASASYIGAPATDLVNGASCSQTNQTPVGDERCVFEDDVLAAEVIDIITHYNVSDVSAAPLFLFWSMHLVHMPLQVRACTPLDYIVFSAFQCRDDSHSFTLTCDILHSSPSR